MVRKISVETFSCLINTGADYGDEHGYGYCFEKNGIKLGFWKGGEISFYKEETDALKAGLKVLENETYKAYLTEQFKIEAKLRKKK